MEDLSKELLQRQMTKLVLRVMQAGCGAMVVGERVWQQLFWGPPVEGGVTGLKDGEGCAG